MKNSLRIAPALLAGTWLLGGCASLYVPTAPATPLLEKGQAEVTVGLRGVKNAEATAAWSPVPHLLLTGELAADILNTSTSTTDAQGTTTSYSDAHHQGGVGMGYYTTLKHNSYLAALAGMGWGRTSFYAVEDYRAASPFLPIPVPTREGVYDARYRRYYGQVYAALPIAARGPKTGFSLRTVWLDYTRLTFADEPIVPTNRVFLEPSIFMRFGQGALRYYVTGGVSLPMSRDTHNPADDRTSSRSYLFSGGIILRPDLLRRHAE